MKASELRDQSVEQLRNHMFDLLKSTLKAF